MDDAEIISDNENPELIAQTKAQYELKKMEKRKAASKIKYKRDGDLGFDEPNENPVPVSASKSKREVAALEKMSKQELQERFLCCVCMEKPRSMLIMTCKHIPFCRDCDVDLRLKHGDATECPLCRKAYKKTVAVQMM